MNWLIIGGGISGLGAAQLLRSEGHDVRISDSKKIPPAMRLSFEKIGVEVCDNGHSEGHLIGIQGLVLSPGVSDSHTLVIEAREKKLRIVSEIDLAIAGYNGKLIGITGTNGKSTTTVMIGHLLRKLKSNYAIGGNLGDPPSAIKAKGDLPEILALELSSYQLEQSHSLAPHIGIFTSFSHDHIERHGSLKCYFAAKWKLICAVATSGIVILPKYVKAQADEFGFPKPNCLAVIIEQSDGERISGGELRLSSTGAIVDASGRIFFNLGPSGITERHNLLNAAFAIIAVSNVTGTSPDELVPMLKDFKGLPHRCELIGEISGKSVINDSKSTNVESTVAAVESQEDAVVLMMGGQGKGEPYDPVLRLAPKIRRLITFGASGSAIEKALSGLIATTNYSSLKNALETELEEIKNTPDTLLFSPGCASFDEFNNYEHRGEFFREACKKFFDE